MDDNEKTTLNMLKSRCRRINSLLRNFNGSEIAINKIEKTYYVWANESKLVESCNLREVEACINGFEKAVDLFV